MNRIFTPDQLEAIRERRGFTTPHLVATHTKGGTYVIASSGRWNDDGKPRDLLAVLPGDLGQGVVIQLYVGASPDLMAEVAEIFTPAEPERGTYAVRAVLSHFGHPAGVQAGGFVTSLLETMGRADSGNRAKLVAAFPEWGVPFVIAKDVAGGTDALATQLGA
jgi:hypothetical protein